VLHEGLGKMREGGASLKVDTKLRNKKNGFTKKKGVV